MKLLFSSNLSFLRLFFTAEICMDVSVKVITELQEVIYEILESIIRPDFRGYCWSCELLIETTV